jgi:hypothetical protein
MRHQPLILVFFQSTDNPLAEAPLASKSIFAKKSTSSLKIDVLVVPLR